MTKLAIKLFGYDNAQTILNRPLNGQRWYMASDICGLLGIRAYSHAVHGKHKDEKYNLSDAEWKLNTTYTGSAKRQILLVNTSGMFKLIMQADPDAAREIQDKALSLKRQNLFHEM